MLKSYLRLFFALFLMTAFAGCREDEPLLPDDTTVRGDRVPVEFDVDIVDCGGTRGILSESKTSFDNNDLLHVTVVYKCVNNGREYKTISKYYTLTYSHFTDSKNNKHNGKWNAPADMIWPDDAVSGTFTAYYIAGTTSPLSTESDMPEKLLSEHKASDVPLYAEVKDAPYGNAIKLQMVRMFSALTLTEIEEGISDDMWFTVPVDDGVTLNNAFKLNLTRDGEGNEQMVPEFLQVPSSYKDSKGGDLVYVSTYAKDDKNADDVEEEGSSTGLTFFLEPKEYGQFNIIYRRNNYEYMTYLNFTGRLSDVEIDSEGNKVGPLEPNCRYVFNIRKSIGVVTDQTPEDGWDKTEPRVLINVEKFLRAINSQSEYEEWDEETQQFVDILAQTSTGTRLLRNVSFSNFYYDTFGDDAFKPNLNSTFDGDYHYIYDMACPLFYQNAGNIKNLGIRDVSTKVKNRPIISCENIKPEPSNADILVNTSNNGIIAAMNTSYGTVDNVRIVNVDMDIKILTTAPEHPTQEVHNMALLFGWNEGRARNISLAGELNITIGNADGHDIVPKPMIGGLAGQNTGTISNVSYIDDIDNETSVQFEMPVINIVNVCNGDLGAFTVGGLAGLNSGNLEDIFLPAVNIDASKSRGVVSYIGGLVGESPVSPSGAPTLNGNIVSGSVKAGQVIYYSGVDPETYTGGIVGAMSIQTNISDCSVSVDVNGVTGNVEHVDYGVGGAIGIIRPLPVGSTVSEGSVSEISCYGNVLTGSGYKGNFAGIAPKYKESVWNDDYFKTNIINIKKYQSTGNIGLFR